MPVPVNSVTNLVVSAGGVSLPTTVRAFSTDDVLVERRLSNGSYVTLTSPTDYTAAISSANRRVTVTLAEATTDITYRISNQALAQQLSDYTLAAYDPTRLTNDFDKAYLHIQRLYNLISGIEEDLAAADTATTVVNLEGLVDDGETDQSQAFIDLVAECVSEGRNLHIVGKADGTSVLYFDRRVILDAVPAATTFDRVTLRFNAENGAGIRIRGQERELPLVGKAKLWTDVDASGGPVTAFDIDVSAEPTIVSLLGSGSYPIIRGQNGADGDALDGHKFEGYGVSCVQVSGNQYTLTLASGLPGTTEDGIWLREWPDSEHSVSPDHTLISVLAAAELTANATDSNILSIASGKAAALGLAVGDWVKAVDDAIGSDLHGTSAELLNAQLVQITKVTAGSPDVITVNEPVRGAFTTANKARLIVVDTVPAFEFRGPGRAFPIEVVGTAPASPASRRHIFETENCLRPAIDNWCYRYVAADGYTRGAIYRSSYDFEPTVTRCDFVGPTPDFAGAFNGGDHYIVWAKGSTRPRFERNRFLGGRHSLVFGNTTGGFAYNNLLGLSGFQCLDIHGEGETNIELIGNSIIRGPAWADRERHVAIQIGNQTHTYGPDGVIARHNNIVGFDGVDDVGILVVSGCDNLNIDQDFFDPVGTGVLIEADRRAPTVAISNVLVDGQITKAVTGVVVDGRMPAWETETGFEGTLTRPTYCEVTDGSVWSTTETGESGANEPEIGETPEVGVTTWDDGGLTWTLRSLTKYSPIEAITIRAAFTDSVVAPIIARRVTSLNLMDCMIDADEGVRIMDVLHFRAQNLRARIGGSSNDDWLIDEGGNTGEYRVVDANGGGVTDGGSTIVDAMPSGGGGSGTLTGHVTAIIPIQEAGNLTTAMKWATVLDANARHNTIQILLGEAGTVNLPADASEGDEFRIDCVGGSEVITLAVVGAAGTIAGETSVVPAIPSIGLARCVYVDPETSERTYEYEGPLVGVPSYAHGGLVAVDPSGSDQRSTLSGFNPLVPDADEETASFNFDATHPGTVVPANHASTPITATIPANASVPFPNGTILAVQQVGDAAVTLAITSDTMPALTGRTLVSRAKGSTIGARKRSATVWVPIGDFGAS